MRNTVRAYADLLRIHFFFAWPVLFCSGFLLAATVHGTFATLDLVRAALIGFFGFEAGFVLNDYVDCEYDRREIESDRLTHYWRIFGTRPLPAGLIPPRNALALFCILSASAALLILSLPFPNSVYVLAIMVVSFGLEVFYQVRKRNQAHPMAQLAGRVDFALFPVAGYLCIGSPDLAALLYFLFFYPFAEAHLAVNDMIDLKNDRARGMETVTTLYGMRGSVAWISGFLAVHLVMALLFLTVLGGIARAGIAAGLLLLAAALAVLVRSPDSDSGLKVLPLFHCAMLLYAGSIILDSVW